MNMLIYNDGRIIMDKQGTPIEGKDVFSDLYAYVCDPKDGDTLVYDATAGMWVPGNPFPVSITEPEDGDTLAYDAESGKWKNVHAEAAAAGGGEE